MDFTFTLALIGCITGLSSLIIQLFEYLRTIPKLEIQVDDHSNSYFFNTESFGVEGYITKYSAVISLKISNCSLNAITINSIYATYKGSSYNSRHSNDFKFSPKSLLLSEHREEKSYRSYRVTEAIQIPFRIDSYDTIYSSVRLPFVDRFIDHSNINKPITLNLLVVTPKKVFHQKVKLYEYTCLHDLRQYRPHEL